MTTSFQGKKEVTAKLTRCLNALNADFCAFRFYALRLWRPVYLANNVSIRAKIRQMSAAQTFSSFTLLINSRFCAQDQLISDLESFDCLLRSSIKLLCLYSAQQQ
jgi:hypothetical protein